MRLGLGLQKIPLTQKQTSPPTVQQIHQTFDGSPSLSLDYIPTVDELMNSHYELYNTEN